MGLLYELSYLNSTRVQLIKSLFEQVKLNHVSKLIKLSKKPSYSSSTRDRLFKAHIRLVQVRTK